MGVSSLGSPITTEESPAWWEGRQAKKARPRWITASWEDHGSQLFLGQSGVLRQSRCVGAPRFSWHIPASQSFRNSGWDTGSQAKVLTASSSGILLVLGILQLSWAAHTSPKHMPGQTDSQPPLLKWIHRQEEVIYKPELYDRNRMQMTHVI